MSTVTFVAGEVVEPDQVLAIGSDGRVYRARPQPVPLPAPRLCHRCTPREGRRYALHRRVPPGIGLCEPRREAVRQVLRWRRGTAQPSARRTHRCEWCDGLGASRAPCLGGTPFMRMPLRCFECNGTGQVEDVFRWDTPWRYGR